MTLKKYGVDGLIEWHITVPAGKMILNVEFADGKISGYGVSPACYCTTDPVMQQAIERTSHFRRGRIRIVEEREIAPRRIIDVPDWNSARLQLMRMTGLGADRLRTRAEMEEAADEYDIELRTPSAV